MPKEEGHLGNAPPAVSLNPSGSQGSLGSPPSEDFASVETGYGGDPYHSHTPTGVLAESAAELTARYPIEPSDVLPEIAAAAPDRLRLEAPEGMEEAVVGTDNRKELRNDLIGKWPYSALCHLLITFPSGRQESGTAWLISPRLAITAGHCIYNKRHGGYARSIAIWPGRHGGTGHRYQASPRFFVNAPYKTYDDRGDATRKQYYDYGGIVLGQSADSAGAFGFRPYTSAELTSKTVNIVGYPAQRPEPSNPNQHRWQYGELWGHAAAVYSIQDRLLYYTVDTTGGVSGAPVFRSIRHEGSVRYIAVGVHTAAASDRLNQAVRINSTISNTFLQWMRVIG